uniref:HAT C-terminal dimerisation domain-containing protein n=1 Tax=Larimichthys crocea TaxID=215358 RepID=A0A0F8AU71_LARCR
MRETKGPHYELACQVVEEGVFKGVPVRTVGRQTMIPPQKFFDALSNSMLSRMVPEEEIELYDQLNFLKPETWPTPVPVLFGELELRQLCIRLKINDSSVKQDFRDFKDNENMPLNRGLIKLKQVADTLALSTAECERGFSLMNTIISPIRNQFKIDNLSCLMFIKLVGPPLDMWNPTKHVKKWVMTRRSADHIACKQRQERQ